MIWRIMRTPGEL